MIYFVPAHPQACWGPLHLAAGSVRHPPAAGTTVKTTVYGHRSSQASLHPHMHVT